MLELALISYDEDGQEEDDRGGSRREHYSSRGNEEARGGRRSYREQHGSREVDEYDGRERRSSRRDRDAKDHADKHSRYCPAHFAALPWQPETYS